MPAHSYRVHLPSDVSCLSPLKTLYVSRDKDKLRLGIDHVDKEDFIPAFLTAHREDMTTVNIVCGSKVTAIVPFDQIE